MSRVFYSRPLSLGVSREVAVVVLAFVATAATYGFVLYSYTSFFRTQPSTQLSAHSAHLLYYGGCVWRVDVPISAGGSPVNPTHVAVQLSVGGYSATLNASTTKFSIGGRVLYGSVAERLSSSKVLAEVYGSGDRVALDLFVYIDPLGRLNVAVDDDSDGVLDDSFLLRFTQGAGSQVPLDLGSEAVLSTAAGTSLPLEYLTALASASRPGAAIEVVSGGVRYLVPVPEILASLRVPTLVVSSVEGVPGFTVSVVLPRCVAPEGSRLSIKVTVASRVVVDSAVSVPSTGGRAGAVVVPLS